MKRRSKERLVLPWAIDEDELLEFAKVAYPRGTQEGGRRTTAATST